MENGDEVPAANFSACSSMLSPLCSPCPYWGFTQARSRNVDPCDESTLLPALRRWVPNTAAKTHVSATSRLRPAPQACESYNSQTQRYRNLYRSFAGVYHDGHIEMPICSGQIPDFTTWRIGESLPENEEASTASAGIMGDERCLTFVMRIHGNPPRHLNFKEKHNKDTGMHTCIHRHTDRNIDRWIDSDAMYERCRHILVQSQALQMYVEGHKTKDLYLQSRCGRQQIATPRYQGTYLRGADSLL